LLTWEQFEKEAPELASFGAGRMSERVMYLGTVRKDGYPRVHPFTPFLSSGRLFAFMEPTSPKGHDIERDGRYVIHSLVKDMHGTGGEFSVSGRARLVSDPQVRTVAIKGCPYTPAERYVLFEFFIEEAAATHYDGGPQYIRWKESSSSKS
jgi:Pyridoxamine 5'-phosphate oxidase